MQPYLCGCLAKLMLKYMLQSGYVKKHLQRFFLVSVQHQLLLLCFLQAAVQALGGGGGDVPGGRTAMLSTALYKV